MFVQMSHKHAIRTSVDIFQVVGREVKKCGSSSVTLLGAALSCCACLLTEIEVNIMSKDTIASAVVLPRAISVL